MQVKEMDLRQTIRGLHSLWKVLGSKGHRSHCWNSIDWRNHSEDPIPLQHPSRQFSGGCLETLACLPRCRPSADAHERAHNCSWRRMASPLPPCKSQNQCLSLEDSKLKPHWQGSLTNITFKLLVLPYRRSFKRMVIEGMGDNCPHSVGSDARVQHSSLLQLPHSPTLPTSATAVTSLRLPGLWYLSFLQPVSSLHLSCYFQFPCLYVFQTLTLYTM